MSRARSSTTPGTGTRATTARTALAAERRPAAQLIASAFFPVRGAYSSGDRAVVGAQMREIAATGVDQVIVSWWGRGSLEDARLGLTDRGRARGGTVRRSPRRALPGRSAASVEADVAYFRRLGITDVYVYRADDVPAADWAAVNDRLDRALARLRADRARRPGGRRPLRRRLHLRHPRLGRRRASAGSARRRTRRASLCAPSVGPGYDSRRASGDTRVKPRRDGAHVRRDVAGRARVERRPRDDHELQRVARGDADRARPRARRLPQLRRGVGEVREARRDRVPRPHRGLGQAARTARLDSLRR